MWKSSVFVCVMAILSSLHGMAQSGLQISQETAMQIQAEISRQQAQENLLRARLTDQNLSMAEKIRIVSEINQLQLRENLLCAQLSSKGSSQDQVNISSPVVDASQDDMMGAALRNADAQTRQIINQMNNRPGVPEFMAANACVESQPVRAFELYKKSVAQGWAPAYYQLARCYYCGIGTKPDAKLGAKWLIKAANSDHEAAQMDLARAYKAGNGVEQSDELAAQWAQRSQQTVATKQMLMGQIMQNNMEFGQSSVSATRDQILRSKIEREQQSLQATEDRLDQAARSGGSTSSLSATIEAEKRLIQSYQNQLSQ